jgi:diaminopimelate decarboxylase
LSVVSIGSAKRFAKARLGPLLASRQPRRVDLPLARWGLEVGANGTIQSRDALGAIDLEALAAEFGTPVHVVRADLLDRSIDAFLAGRDEPGRAPLGVYYSYKTNPVPGVLQRLHARGIGAEVISAYELWLARRLGVPPEGIIYNGPHKSDDSLREAVRAGIYATNVNSSGELERIERVALEAGRTANVGVRITLAGMWGGQFGIPAHAALPVFERALSMPHVDLRGIHAHRGGEIRTLETLAAHLDGVLQFCDYLFQETGWTPSFLDVGGSLACPSVASIPQRQYRLNRALGTDLLPPDPAATLGPAEAMAYLTRTVHAFFTERMRAVPEVIAEPGRSLTASTQFMLTSVVDVKTEAGLPHAVLDAGINVAESVRGEYHQLFSVSAPQSPARQGYRLAGPICTPADVLYYHWSLPHLAPGHVLAIMDTGAYFVPFSTSFSFPRPPIVMQEGNTIRVLRRAESFEDLVDLDGLDDLDDLNDLEQHANETAALGGAPVMLR